MKSYSVNVGHYENIKDTKKDEKSLRSIGLQVLLFRNKDKYTLRVYTTINEEKARNTAIALTMKGFETYILEHDNSQ